MGLIMRLGGVYETRGDSLQRLRLEAENLFQAVSEFQQRVLGRRDDTFH